MMVVDAGNVNVMEPVRVKNEARLIGIAGGIGSGKSVVSRILRLQGFPVYDCDSRARQLMVASGGLRESLIHLLGERLFLSDGSIDKAYMAECIFTDTGMLKKVNALVHAAVKDDAALQFESVKSGCGSKIMFVESAILAQSGLTDICDAVWEVTAPEAVRLQRVMTRNNLSEDDVRKRMNAQRDEHEKLLNNGVAVKIIENDNRSSLLLQIEELLENIDNYA